MNLGGVTIQSIAAGDLGIWEKEVRENHGMKGK